jgi:hypothetical protein
MTLPIAFAQVILSSPVGAPVDLPIMQNCCSAEAALCSIGRCATVVDGIGTESRRNRPGDVPLRRYAHVPNVDADQAVLTRARDAVTPPSRVHRHRLGRAVQAAWRRAGTRRRLPLPGRLLHLPAGPDVPGACDRPPGRPAGAIPDCRSDRRHGGPPGRALDRQMGSLAAAAVRGPPDRRDDRQHRFALPFITSLYGAEGVVRIAAFDAVNTTLVFSWAYYTAARGNPAHRGGPLLLDRLLKSPPLYAIAAGAAVNAMSISVPDAVTRALTPFATATAMVISIAVGIMLALPREDFWKAPTVVAARLGSGVVVGVLLVVAGLGRHGPHDSAAPGRGARRFRHGDICLARAAGRSARRQCTVAVDGWQLRPLVSRHVGIRMTRDGRAAYGGDSRATR